LRKILLLLAVLLLFVSCALDIDKEPTYHIGLANYSWTSVYWRISKDSEQPLDEFNVLPYGAYQLIEVEPNTRYVLQFGASEDEVETISIVTEEKCNEVNFRMEKTLVCCIKSFKYKEAKK